MWQVGSAGDQKPSSKASNKVIETLVGGGHLSGVRKAIEKRWTYEDVSAS